MIEVGDSGRYIDLDGIKNDLLGKTITLQKYTEQFGLDGSEVEDISDMLAGEIEQCPTCKKWVNTYEIEMDGECNKCLEEPTWLNINKNK